MDRGINDRSINNRSINNGTIVDYLKKSGFELYFEGNKEAVINGFSSLFNYKEGTITFLVPERKFTYYESNFVGRNIQLIVIGKEENSNKCFNSVIRVEDPRKAFFAVLEKFFDQSDDESVTGITANPDVYRRNSYVSDKAVIGKNVKIGVGCVIEGNVIIGDNTEIHHNVVIRNRTRIGANCTIFSGTIIGERGFNYTINEDCSKHMLKHYGGVVIEDDVHIGDNCCIIQGAIDDTVIKRGVKINTMVHIAHNDVIGQNTIITAPTHVCGSVTIGANCHVGSTIIRNQVSIGDNAFLGLGSVVVKDVQSGGVVVGNPARSMKVSK